MFFWKKINATKFSEKKASLQTCHGQINPNLSDVIFNPKSMINKKSKRAFSFMPSFYRASMCVEAALSFSFFLFFLFNVFSIILLFQMYIEDMAVLQQKGKTLASYAYVTDGIEGQKEDVIRLKNSRTVESVFSILAIPQCKLISTCVVKPWTGYDVTVGKNRKEEEQIVYVTQYGKVFHKDRGCTHLALSVQAVEIDHVRDMRNETGESYAPCEHCKENGYISLVYITNYGNRYHTFISCQGLKRYVRCVPFSQVEGMSPCKKCGY